MCLVASAAGCSTVPVATNLDEDDANRMVVALDQRGLSATKEGDPAAEGRFRIRTPRDESSKALAALQEEHLPRQKNRGLADTTEHSALVPSESAEHAQRVAGLASELEGTLGAIEGVVRARVHLNLPRAELGIGLRDGAATKSTASVLIEYRYQEPPLPQESVQRLVAGSCPNLAPADVAVLFHARRPANASSGSTGVNAPEFHANLGRVGPFTVASSSVPALRTLLVSLVTAVGFLGALVLVLHTQNTRLRRKRITPRATS